MGPRRPTPKNQSFLAFRSSVWALGKIDVDYGNCMEADSKYGVLSLVTHRKRKQEIHCTVTD